MSSSEGCPVKQDLPTSSASNDGCPVKGEKVTTIPGEVGYNPAANDLSFNQHRQPDQVRDMSTVRAVSGIDKSTYTPGHQFANVDKWVYPSEQQYFNAMKRKGYNPPEEDVSVIVAIHNIINEQGWSKIKQWESLRGCEKPKLKQFSGRPKDISPKAYLLNCLGYELPFDRHDWIVDRDGKDVRYIIDFHRGSEAIAGSPLSVHLDVRPAVDSYEAVIDRMSVTYRQFLGKNPFVTYPAASTNTDPKTDV